jgi:hypothetical protein
MRSPLRTLPWLLAALPAASAVVAVLPAFAQAEAPKPAAVDTKAAEFFEARIRPLLVEQCLGCHSGSKLMGKLDLSSRDGVLKGGTRGASVVPGSPEKSALLAMVRYEHEVKMPPSGRLSDARIRDLDLWIRGGAQWGFERKTADFDLSSAEAVRKQAQQHWAYRPVVARPVPAVKNRVWARNDVDRFLLAALEKQGLRPNPYADRRTLIRRVTFDLTGLPPTPEETRAFLADTQPGAWERVIERLLASPRYGERWGRHWLDVARYADSNGQDWNEVFPNAWRYRDYVIQSFNEDKPYDRFILEQLAGDQLPAAGEAERHRNLIATGFLVMGPKLLAQQDRARLVMDVVDEQIDVTSKAFLGVTTSCARCHDHKFDPFPTRDYYALAGIFKSTRTLNGTLPRNDRVMYWNEIPLAPEAHVKARQAHEAELKKMADRLKKAKDAGEKERLTADMKALEQAAPPPVPMAMAAADGPVADVPVHLRGSTTNLGDVAPRGFLTALEAPGTRPEKLAADRSGRLELARWIASPRNPLTARVMVNRIWLHHFGEGLVPTPDNFGRLGEKPSHPELLDYLAARFVQGGWSVKAMHRLLLTTAAYQMAGADQAAGLAKDPANRLLWRANRRRLESEAIRDAMLFTAGELNLQTGGTMIDKASGFPVREFPVQYTGSRRSVYQPVLRVVTNDFQKAFDQADPSIVMGKRNVTTVATQGLLMLNSQLAIGQSEKFAQRLLALPGGDDERVEAAYERAFGRIPTSAERDRALAFIRDFEAALPAAEADKNRQEAWRAFCHTLFASSEFRYVE